MHVSILKQPKTCKTNSYYCSNKPPLLLSPLTKLPLGNIRPKNWLKHQLDLMVNGMTGRLMELSIFLQLENGWFGGNKPGWEEQPYWFRGFHDLAVLTGNKRLLDESSRWIEAVLNSQDDDGYFGAKYNKSIVGKNGQKVCDLWPHMIMLDALIRHYEHTGDQQIIPMIKRFFQFCSKLPEEMFIPAPQEGFGACKLSVGSPFVQYSRAGDMLPHIYWLYNQTGDFWLLDLATRFYKHIKPATDEWLDHHVVHFTQRFRYPGNYYIQSKDALHLAASEYWYTQHLNTWGQQPRGIFGADENIRSNCTDPRQGFETCGMVEFMKSFYILGRITGDAKYADRCEDIALNHFPVSQMPNLKGLHYLTASNQPQLDASGNHEYYNKGRMICYSPHIYRCCQHNIAMGWPLYVQNLWQATSDNGLAAWLYAPSEVTAKVGKEGREVEFHVKVNGELLDLEVIPVTYVCIERVWSANDTVIIDMPMTISLTQWPRNGSVTVDRGPLSYSLKIEERWRRCGGTDKWPEWEVLPITPWNYGLVINRDNPHKSLEVVKKNIVANQPWTIKDAPIEIKARGKRIPKWELENETVAELQQSPVKTDQPEEQITLVPMGCARLRISCLPTIDESPSARNWE
jgi:hypothetical protein